LILTDYLALNSDNLSSRQRLIFHITLCLLLLAGTLFNGCSPEQEEDTQTGKAPTVEEEELQFTDFSDTDLVNIRSSAKNLEPLTSLLISRENEIILEHYQNGLAPGDGVNVKSASKSILSALVGIALQEGDLESLEATVGDFFPGKLQNSSEKRKNITVRNLLLMRSGLQTTSFDNYGHWTTSSNWLDYALNQPFVAAPGKETEYSTGDSHILAALLTRATGRDLKDYAQQHLFDPLNVLIHHWQRSPEGYRFGGNNLTISPRGMLRLGKLYLNDGRWQGEQLIASNWVEESTRAHVEDTFHSYPYGYYWWNNNYRDLDAFFAWGYGGQFIFVIPEFEMVIVTTTNLHSTPNARDFVDSIHELLREDIISRTLKP